MAQVCRANKAFCRVWIFCAGIFWLTLIAAPPRRLGSKEEEQHPRSRSRRSERGVGLCGGAKEKRVAHPDGKKHEVLKISMALFMSKADEKASTNLTKERQGRR